MTQNVARYKQWFYAHAYSSIGEAMVFGLVVRAVETGEARDMNQCLHEGLASSLATNFGISKRNMAKQECLRNLCLLEQAEVMAKLI